MSHLIVQVLSVIGLLGTLVVLYRITRAARQCQAETRRVCKHQLAELDVRPEFQLSPPDWPLRESPPRRLERAQGHRS